MTEREKVLRQIELYQKALSDQDAQGYTFQFRTDGVNMARFLDAVEKLLKRQ